MPKKKTPSQSPPSPRKKPTHQEIRRDQIRNELVQHMQDLRLQATEEKLAEDELTIEQLNALALDVEISNKFGNVKLLPWKGNVEARKQLQEVKRRLDRLWESIKDLPMEALNAVFEIERREKRENLLVPFVSQFEAVRQELDLARTLLPSRPSKRHNPPKRGQRANDQAIWVTKNACDIFEYITGRIPERINENARVKSKFDAPALQNLKIFFLILGIDASADHYLKKYCEERKILSKKSN